MPAAFDEKLFDSAKKELNMPDTRLRISQMLGRPGVYQGGTFWCCSESKGWESVTGDKTKLFKWLDLQLKNAKKNKKNKKMVVDIGTSTKGCSHYISFMINFTLEEGGLYGGVFDAGVGTTPKKNTWADGKKIKDMLTEWIDKKKTFFPYLWHFIDLLPVQRSRKNTLCQTYSIMFRQHLQADWTDEDITNWVRSIGELDVVKTFKKIFTKDATTLKTLASTMNADKKEIKKLIESLDPKMMVGLQ